MQTEEKLKNSDNEEKAQVIIYKTKEKVNSSVLFEFLLKKFISGSNTHLTPLEYRIAQGVFDTDGVWNTKYLMEKLLLDTYSLNNYKKKLLEKQIILKGIDKVVLNPVFTKIKKGMNKIILTFQIDVDNEVPLTEDVKRDL